MFRLTRVIVRLRSDPLNVFNDCVHLGSQKAYNFCQLLTYNYYLKVLLCVSIAVSTLEYCPVLQLLLNFLLFLASIRLLSVCALVVPSRGVLDYLPMQQLRPQVGATIHHL
jgi:hypothetical protein